MNKEEIVIDIKDLRKEYKMFNHKKDRLLEAIFPMYKKHKSFAAIDNMNLQVKKGEILGIIGKNGAGKSTLLKIITGVVVPNNGEVKVNGKISSLLELGAAFNPELTGYENIYQHGEVMGLTKEQIKEKEQEIIDFADIGEHLYQPVKTYSSGMFARLAFACAINVEPDVLIVDEVLSVGDMAFQEKSITKMKEIRKRGTTILFVSHSLEAIKHFCSRVIWMKDGKIVMDGNTQDVTEKYKNDMIDEKRKLEIEEKIKVLNEEKKKNENTNKSIEIRNVKCNKKEYNLYEDIVIEIELSNNKNIENFGVGILLMNSKSELITALNTIRMEKKIDKEAKKIKFKIKRNCLNEDIYYITVSICDEKVMFSYDKEEFVESFKVIAPKNSFGMPISEGVYACEYEIDEE